MAFGSDQCEDVWAPFALSCTTASCAAILCIITVPGNVLICWAIIRDPFHELKSSFNYFVLNLAIADLFIGAVTEPVFVWYHTKEALHHRVLGLRWLVYMSYFMTCAASLFSIAALTFDRYLTVTSSYRRKIEASRAIAVSVAIWVVSLAVPFLYFAIGFYKFAFIFANTAIVTTLAILVFSFIRIQRSLRSHAVQIAAILQEKNRLRNLQMERKVTKYFLYILLSFAFCSVPSCVMIYVINLCSTCHCDVIHWFRDFQYIVVLINSSTNQFLYAWRMPNFRRAFRLVTRKIPLLQSTSVTVESAGEVGNSLPLVELSYVAETTPPGLRGYPRQSWLNKAEWELRMCSGKPWYAWSEKKTLQKRHQALLERVCRMTSPNEDNGHCMCCVWVWQSSSRAFLT